MKSPVARPATPTVWVALAGTALLAASAVGAATLVDPTLPPPVQAAAGAIAPTGLPAVAAPTPAKLQMILRGPGDLRTALVDGRAVHVGDRLDSGSGAARVVRITDGSVELARGAAHETLELIPGQAQIVRCARPGGPGVAPGSTDPCARRPPRAADR